MSRKLLVLGCILAALAVWAWIAGSSGWIPARRAEAWAWMALKGALAAMALGGAMMLLGPLVAALRGRRCARCGAPAARSSAYCLDHTKQAIDEARDQTRPSLLAGSGTHSRRRPVSS